MAVVRGVRFVELDASRRVTRHAVDPVDLLNDQIEYLKSLLADLLTDCENWGCAPNERYAEALR